MVPQMPGKALNDFIESHRRDSDMLLQRLKWDTNTKQLEGIFELKIDCYTFRFRPNLTGCEQYAFLDFLETLNLASEHAILKAGIWLLQHNISFRLQFSWNRHLPWFWCLPKLWRPRKIYRLLMKNRERCLKHDLSADTHALKQPAETDSH